MQICTKSLKWRVNGGVICQSTQKYFIKSTKIPLLPDFRLKSGGGLIFLSEVDKLPSHHKFQPDNRQLVQQRSVGSSATGGGRLQEDAVPLCAWRTADLFSNEFKMRWKLPKPSMSSTARTKKQLSLYLLVVWQSWGPSCPPPTQRSSWWDVAQLFCFVPRNFLHNFHNLSFQLQSQKDTLPPAQSKVDYLHFQNLWFCL